MRDFSLSGLLRLRRLQQDQAGANVLRARSRASELAAQRTHVREAMLGRDNDAADISTMHAIAAARASTSSMLADLAALEIAAQGAVDEATREHALARRAVLSIEKLETKHIDAARSEELRAEQNTLDELSMRPRFRFGADDGEQIESDVAENGASAHPERGELR